MGIFLAILAIIIIWVFAILEVPFFAWLLTLFLAIFALCIVKVISLIAFLISTSILAILGVFCAYRPIRRKYLSAFLYTKMAKLLPAISNTEMEVLEAGDTWFETELLRGSPNWNKMLQMKKAILTKAEQNFLDNQVETLCAMVNDWEVINKTLDLPIDAWDYIKKERFFSMIIPKKYGGLEFSATANSAVIQKLASRSVTLAITVMVPNSLGPGELLLKYGTKEQCNEYLPKLASGEHIPCFGLTSEDAGSDAANMVDNGVVCMGTFQGKKTLGIKLNWNKRYITLAPVATILGLAFKLFDPEKLLGETKELGITVCLIPTNLPGIEVGNRHLPSGMAFMNGPTRGKDVFVPLDFIIGGQAQIGKGWLMLVECLSVGRGISLPSLVTSCAKHTFRTTGAYASLRKQFKIAIGEFEGVQEAMARIGGFTYILEAARLFTTAAIDGHIKPAVATAIAKYHMTELSRVTVQDAMDIHGGKGVILGPKNYLHASFISTPMGITVEGANILTRCMIIFGQGVVRCHPYLKNEIKALHNENKTKGIVEFDQNFFAHISYAMSNIAKLKAHLVTFGLFYKSSVQAQRFLKPYYKKLSKYSLALACMTDVTLAVLGGQLKRKENISARLGDILSFLYLGSSVLKYYNDQGNIEADKPFVRWALDFCIYSIEAAFLELFHNFPNRLFALQFRMIIFPFGIKLNYPKDNLNASIANCMMTTGGIRDKVKKDLFTSKDDKDPLYILEAAFLRLNQVKPIIAKIIANQKTGNLPKNQDLTATALLAKDASIISNNELNDIVVFEQLRKSVISVDEFSKNDLEKIKGKSFFK